MILGVNIGGKASVASVSGTGGSEGCYETLSRVFREQSPQRKHLGSKEDLDLA